MRDAVANIVPYHITMPMCIASKDRMHRTVRGSIRSSKYLVGIALHCIALAVVGGCYCLDLVLVACAFLASFKNLVMASSGSTPTNVFCSLPLSNDMTHGIPVTSNCYHIVPCHAVSSHHSLGVVQRVGVCACATYHGSIRYLIDIDLVHWHFRACFLVQLFELWTEQHTRSTPSNSHSHCHCRVSSECRGSDLMSFDSRTVRLCCTLHGNRQSLPSRN
jgi:hypothetical protein